MIVERRAGPSVSTSVSTGVSTDVSYS